MVKVLMASSPRTPTSGFESCPNNDPSTTSNILVISSLGPDFMDPSEDIIDVLYRFREDPSANQSHHRRGTPTHRFFQRHDSLDGASSAGRYPSGGVPKHRSISLQLEREDSGALEEMGAESIYGGRGETPANLQGRIEAHPRNVRVDVIPQGRKRI
ncbi:hypothetical protein TCAL_05337 [Tigriopus californicus]|uniref:Uncharacterized protein n=1 Tax=Tigriopus californicus TaxID=6832 RepID=A0A553PFF6_TIGCA|nr:hypothetical protein TCAL_05337 [Tigriopus californicus]|eukprot:TCALIF_05337-PA protein Name:"Protein of unknown function" AED:0.51 eAED:0.51 QI:0/0/0/0.5/1/1/2/0/156